MRLAGALLASLAAALLAIVASGFAGAASEGSPYRAVWRTPRWAASAPGLEVVLHREGLTLHEHEETITPTPRGASGSTRGLRGPTSRMA